MVSQAMSLAPDVLMSALVAVLAWGLYTTSKAQHRLLTLVIWIVFVLLLVCMLIYTVCGTIVYRDALDALRTPLRVTRFAKFLVGVLALVLAWGAWLACIEEEEALALTAWMLFVALLLCIAFLKTIAFVKTPKNTEEGE